MGAGADHGMYSSKEYVSRGLIISISEMYHHLKCSVDAISLEFYKHFLTETIVSATISDTPPLSPSIEQALYLIR